MTQKTALVPATRDTHALEPADMTQALQLAAWMHKSGMFPDTIKSPEQGLMIIMKARELGISALQAATDINVIKGKVSISSALMVGTVLGRGAAVYFRPVLDECNDRQATYETLRRGEDKPQRFTFTMDMAQKMGLTERDQYRKQPGTMLRWRAASALARAIYPDVLAGCYTPDEIADIAPAPEQIEARVETRAAASAQAIEALTAGERAVPPLPKPDSWARLMTAIGEAQTIDEVDAIEARCKGSKRAADIAVACDSKRAALRIMSGARPPEADVPPPPPESEDPAYAADREAEARSKRGR